MSRLVIKVIMILHIKDPSKCRSHNSREKRYMKSYILRFYSKDYSHLFSFIYFPKCVFNSRAYFLKLSKETKVVSFAKAQLLWRNEMHRIVSLFLLSLLLFSRWKKFNFTTRKSSLVILASKDLVILASKDHLWYWPVKIFYNFFTIVSVSGLEWIIFGNIIHTSKLENLIKLFGFLGC